MRRVALALAVAVLVAAGCVGQVVLSQYQVAPNNDVELAVVYRATPGTKFSDVAEKTLNVSVSVAGRSSSESPIYLLARQYSIITSDIDWSIDWESPDRGKVEFVVYPPGLGKYDIPAAERNSRSKPLGHIVVNRQSADAFEIVSEEWAVPYRVKNYSRGLWKW